jgi:NADH-quinone oxidoreductase subunit E
MNLTAVQKTIKKYGGKRPRMIAILQDIQAEYGYLPEDALRMVAQETGRPLVDVFGLASFYHSFSLKPRGKHLVSVCLGTACHVRAGAQVGSEFERRLGVQPGDTTADGQFTLETVNCLGCCAIGPVVVIDGKYHGQVTVRDVPNLIKGCRGEGSKAAHGEAKAGRNGRK